MKIEQLELIGFQKSGGEWTLKISSGVYITYYKGGNFWLELYDSSEIVNIETEEELKTLIKLLTP